MWELLAPAGSYESIIAAVNAGADAVYVGGKMFGARAYADNPEEEQLLGGLEYCHIHDRKLYLTVNTLLKEHELATMLYPYLLPYYENGIDGVIVQDFGVMRFVQEHFPGLPVHASTQMTVTGPEGARLLKEQGVSRVVVARELSLEEIHTIAEDTGIEIEAFVHGAMCYSYSGQCLFSSLLGGRSGNRGRCAQPCRLPYRVQGNPGPAACLLSMKDMCTLDRLPDILEAGVSSLKIEGRMKRPEYTAGVVSIYRKYLDLYQDVGKKNYRVEDADRKVLLDLYNRGGFSGGYYYTHNGKEMMSTHRPNHMGTAVLKVSAGKSGKPKYTAIEPLGKGDMIELAPGREITLGEDVEKGEAVRLPLPKDWRPKDGLLYRTKNARLLEELKNQYLAAELRERISGELLVSAEAPAVLRLRCRDVFVECSLEIAEPALKQSADVNSVRRQMLKTGNTPFVFDRLDISLADGLFLPVAKLNELRRTGLSLLKEKLLADRRRSAVVLENASGKRENVIGERIISSADDQSFDDQPRKATAFQINILVTTEAQLEAVLECREPGIDTIYLDSLIFGMLQDQEAKAIQIVERVKRRGWRCFLSCPSVLRSRERAFLSGHTMQTVMRKMDGYLLHTIDELAFFQDYIRENKLSSVLAADDNLYAYNRCAADFLRGQGVGRFTLPAELNARELLDLNQTHAELNVYGYQALMQSAQCVVKNTDRCTGTPSVIYLTDRKNARFPVLNRCLFCCNTIYNSVPLMLCGCQPELVRLAPAYVRLSFTIETKEEAADVIEACVCTLRGDEPKGDFTVNGTRGHFRRGVE